VNELMLREMASQTGMLAEAIDSLRDQASEIAVHQPGRVVLAGSGDSGYAAIAVEELFSKRLAVPVWALPSISAARFPRCGPGDLEILVSVSGEVVRTVEAARTARSASCRTLAVVANADSTLARECDAAMVMPKPITRATPHTRDYTATLLALGVTGERLARSSWPDLDAWVDSVGQLLERSLVWAQQLPVPPLESRLWFLGSGPDRGTAAYGALKLWEAGGEPSWWDDLEEFAHGSQLQARPGDDVVVFATGRARTRAAEMVAGLQRMEMRTLLITDSEFIPGVPEPLQFRLPQFDDPAMAGFYSCIPVQALTYRYAGARNIDVTLPMGGAPFGQTYEDVHNEWMRNSKIEEV
jgi:glutamine---fructose-6-phosphate transaminase (isomerizing)